MAWWIWKFGWRWCGRLWVCPILRRCPNICLQKLWENANISQDIRPSRKGKNLGPPEKDAVVLTTQTLCLVASVSKLVFAWFLPRLPVRPSYFIVSNGLPDYIRSTRGFSSVEMSQSEISILTYNNRPIPVQYAMGVASVVVWRVCTVI